MTDPIEKRKKKEKLLIAERKVEKAWVRTSKINHKLKKAKKHEEKPITRSLKQKLIDAMKRLKRNKKELKSAEKKVS
ncbi:MAG: hypothetical protein WCX31_18620 [Salinivirgaceae bacterium]|jgi:hypothetical protein